jgi:hypothetical protein
MKDEKRHEILMHLLVNTYAEILTLKEFTTADIMIRNKHLSIEDNEKFMQGYNEKLKEFQIKILAQLRERYDDTLGSVDDLLNGLL